REAGTAHARCIDPQQADILLLERLRDHVIDMAAARIGLPRRLIVGDRIGKPGERHGLVELGGKGLGRHVDGALHQLLMDLGPVPQLVGRIDLDLDPPLRRLLDLLCKGLDVLQLIRANLRHGGQPQGRLRGSGRCQGGRDQKGASDEFCGGDRSSDQSVHAFLLFMHEVAPRLPERCCKLFALSINLLHKCKNCERAINGARLDPVLPWVGLITAPVALIRRGEPRFPQTEAWLAGLKAMRRGLASFRIGAFKKGWMMESDGKSSARKKRKLDQDLDATAAAIAEIRAARRMTLADLGQRSGVAASTISRIENRQTSPTFVVLQKIAAGLSVPVSSLLSKPRDRFAGGRRSVIRAGEGTPL